MVTEELECWAKTGSSLPALPGTTGDSEPRNHAGHNIPFSLVGFTPQSLNMWFALIFLVFFSIPREREDIFTAWEAFPYRLYKMHWKEQDSLCARSLWEITVILVMVHFCFRMVNNMLWTERLQGNVKIVNKRHLQKLHLFITIRIH